MEFNFLWVNPKETLRSDVAVTIKKTESRYIIKFSALFCEKNNLKPGNKIGIGVDKNKLALGLMIDSKQGYTLQKAQKRAKSLMVSISRSKILIPNIGDEIKHFNFDNVLKENNIFVIGLKHANKI